VLRSVIDMFSLPVQAGVASTALLAQHAASMAIEGDVSQMTAEDNVEQLIKQFNAATGEFLKGTLNPERSCIPIDKT
jgi:hypothetical protein